VCRSKRPDVSGLKQGNAQGQRSMDRFSQREPVDPVSVYLKAEMAHDLVVK
jgi:hypothetical protein